MPKMVEANSLIENFLSGETNTKFIDVYHKMLNDDGAPVKSLFIEDNLHMNANGYKIWQKIIEPFSTKITEKMNTRITRGIIVAHAALYQLLFLPRTGRPAKMKTFH